MSLYLTLTLPWTRVLNLTFTPWAGRTMRQMAKLGKRLQGQNEEKKRMAPFVIGGDEGAFKNLKS